MTDITARVLRYIRKHALLRPGDRVGVAVSGGADSVALLRILIELRTELGAVLSVVHFNHRLRGADSDADEAFVRELAAAHNLDFHSGSGDTRTFAQSNKLSLETAARELRYAYFRSLLNNGTGNNALDKIATAHTLDDQAETVLMRILRGTGIAGLGAIPRALTYTDTDSQQLGAVVRPLLGARRAELELYLHGLKQTWCEDATNSDIKFTRNRVRHTLLPLLEREFNPSIKERLSELAESAQADDEYCEAHSLAEGIKAWVAWPCGFHGVSKADSPIERARDRDIRLGVPQHDRIDLDCWSPLHLAAKRRLVRQILCGIGPLPDFGHVEDVLALGSSFGPNSEVNLPEGIRVQRKTEHDDRGRVAGHYLVFQKTATVVGGDYSYPLNVPEDVHIPELRTLLRTRLVPLTPPGADRVKQRETPASDPNPSYTRSQLLNPQLLTSELLVRNWHPGDRFWPAHTSSPKKIKELLQQKHITGPARQTWPVVVSGDEIVWMRGFPIPEKYRVPEGAETGLLIEEVAEVDWRG